MRFTTSALALLAAATAAVATNVVSLPSSLKLLYNYYVCSCLTVLFYVYSTTNMVITVGSKIGQEPTYSFRTVILST
jgi:hypothetical protein